MRIVVSGASGFIGSALVKALDAEGQDVVRLVRRAAKKPNEVSWNPARGELDVRGLSECRAIVHLAGENIAGRWTEAKMVRILDSRIRGTRLLAEAMGRVGGRPKVFVSASASGYYGDRGGEVLSERSAPGVGFLPDVCKEWEAASWPAAQHGLRVVNPRFGMVLDSHGGALAAMLPVYRAGLGGILGDGRQHMPWVTIEDAVAAIMFLINEPSVAGPVNVTSPHSVTNRKFVKTLAGVLHKPAFMRVPRFALRLMFGKMADEVLLASANVVPEKLLEAGFRFCHPELEEALKSVLS